MRLPIFLNPALFWRLVNAHLLTVDHREGMFFTEHDGTEFCTAEAAS